MIIVQALDRRFRIHDAVAEEYLDGQVFLLNIASGVYFELDLVGSQIWEMLRQEATEGAICSRLLENYLAEWDRIRADVAEFLDYLMAYGLLRRIDD
jgi:hypothetical protein